MQDQVEARARVLEAKNYLRLLARSGPDRTFLAVADAASVRQGVALVLGISDYELTVKLSDQYRVTGAPALPPIWKEKATRPQA